MENPNTILEYLIRVHLIKRTLNKSTLIRVGVHFG